MYAVTFALPDESSEFRKHIRASSGGQGTLHGQPVVIGHIGVGAAAAAGRVRQFLAQTRPEVLICAGYGGGLDPALRVGDLVLDLHQTAPEWHPRELSAAVRRGRIQTEATAAESVEEKRSLFARSGAAVVDMETAVVAEACAAAGVPLLALRVISDEATQPLPVPMAYWFDLHRQRPRPIALFRYLASHPSRIAPFTKFVRGLPGARRKLSQCLSELLADFAARHPAAAG